MTYNPEILQDILRARSLNRTILSERLGLQRNELDAALSREPEPKHSLLNKIARELALPAFVFYMAETPPIVEGIPDFRLPSPAVTQKSRQTIEAIQLARAIQRACVENKARPADRLPELSSQGVEEASLQIRNFFGITLEDQLGCKNAKEFYLICRKKIEDRGIFVIHESFPSEDGSGFCLADDRYPVIVVNTQKQTRGRRLFTLIHELGHVLLHQTGVSDPFSRNNRIEVLCNRFATAFLTPKDYLASLLGSLDLTDRPDLDEVRRVAARLRISQQAAVLRLEQLNFYREGTAERWLRLIHNLGNPDFSEKGGGNGEPPPQEKVKLAKYGFHFARAFGELLESGRLSDVDLYRISGLKPKYRRLYFDFANSLTGDELTGVELDDE